MSKRITKSASGSRRIGTTPPADHGLTASASASHWRSRRAHVLFENSYLAFKTYCMHEVACSIDGRNRTIPGLARRLDCCGGLRPHPATILHDGILHMYAVAGGMPDRVKRR
jgi:hypothetical protein